MLLRNRIATLLVAATISLGWADSADAQPYGDFYTVHAATVSLPGSTQENDEDCRRDAESCAARERVNTRGMVEELCGGEDLPRELRLVVLMPCPFLEDDWILAVWDRENEEVAECNQIPFTNTYVVFDENASGSLREMRMLSSTGGIRDLDFVESSLIPLFENSLTARASVRVADVPARLMTMETEELALGETLEGAAQGIIVVEEEEPLRCAANLNASSVIGLLPRGVMEYDTLLPKIPGGSVMLVEGGRISAGRPFELIEGDR